MERTYPWADQILKLLKQVGGATESACSGLTAARPHFESPSALSTGDAEGGIGVIALVEGKLEDASSDLAGAVACMEAAAILDLRSGSHSLAALLASVDNLQEARARVEDALRATDRCRGHLGAAKLLLGHPGVPGADGCIEAERVAAVRALEAALRAVGG